MLTYHFENRTAIVTGGSRGIGAATVKAFLQAGATVVAVYSSNDDDANAFKVSLGELAANLTLAKLNVADYAQAEDFFRQFDESHPTTPPPRRGLSHLQNPLVRRLPAATSPLTASRLVSLTRISFQTCRQNSWTPTASLYR